MERRTFLALLPVSLLAAPLAAEAQPAGKVPGWVTYRRSLVLTLSSSALSMNSGKGCASSAMWKGRVWRSSTAGQRERSNDSPTSLPSWFG